MDRSRYRQVEGQLWSASGAEPEETEVRLPRLGTNLRVQMAGTGPPVLFVHGAPSAGTTWAPLVSRLTGFRCYVFDRPGAGLSEPLPGGWSVPRIITYGEDLVADVLDGLELDRAHVVASSFGGHLALRSAAAHPDRFNRMVQMSCPAATPGGSIPGFVRFLTAPLLGGLVRRMPPTRGSTMSVMRQMGHGASVAKGTLPDGFIDWYLALQRHTDTMRHDGATMAPAIRRGRFADGLLLDDDLLAGVKAPTLFLWGGDDGFGGPEVGTRLVSRLPDATLDVFEHGGHLPWLDDPAGATAAVKAWLRLDATTPA